MVEFEWLWKYAIDPPWTRLQPVAIGQATGTPGQFLTVSRGGEPWLRLDIHLSDEYQCFQEVLVRRGVGNPLG